MILLRVLPQLSVCTTSFSSPSSDFPLTSEIIGIPPIVTESNTEFPTPPNFHVPEAIGRRDKKACLWSSMWHPSQHTCDQRVFPVIEGITII